MSMRQVCLVNASILPCQQVDELISRIQGALPSAPLVGGVTQPNAWGVNPWGGKRSLRGAVFLNQRTYDEGAVGCFMQGPLKVAHPYNRLLDSKYLGDLSAFTT